MTKVPSIVVVGAGSAVFGLSFLQDLFQAEALRGSSLWLVDVNPQALARMQRLADRLNAAAGAAIRVQGTTLLDEALPGANFVVTSVAVDRIPSWQADHKLALRHGFASVLSENGGPGGLSHTLRSVPLMLGIAQQVQRLAPGAWLLNYTNPENRVCLAISRYTNVRTIGLCHGVAATIEWACGLLGREQHELDMVAVGVNHFTWVTSLTDRRTGYDLMPAFDSALEGLPDDVWPLCRYTYRRLGTFPTTGDDHVGEYLPWAAGIIGTKGYDFEAFTREASETAARIERWGAGVDPVDALLAEPSFEARVNHSAARLIADMVAGEDGHRPSFIVPNDGLVPGLAPDSVVEVPGRLARGVPRGRALETELPVAVRALVEREQEIQSLAVDAAVTGSRDLALRALLVDPLVHDARAAEAFLEEALQRHRAYLPRFWADGAEQPLGGTIVVS
ncbi:MAG: alpha-glucosidase/alpha-galactosidase [Chloroflexi bacterium]|nr:alpha-glucosidase/alpha-galactosidase [Chloroflexota bacterium]